jgi:23S rRNA pseudouridine1911/1915/1917 synthase
VREALPEAALLEVRLETGRQHQIRVHLAHAGLPILGDAVYGTAPQPEDGMLARRPLLHAFRLAFDHPVTGERVSVECAPPDDFQRVLARLRKRRG